MKRAKGSTTNSYMMESDDQSQQQNMFQNWMKDVDRFLEGLCGLSSLDLSDYCYRDAFEDGVSAKRAAAMALKSDWPF